MIGLNRGNHGIDGPSLERVHGRGPGAIDMAKLRVSGAHVEHAPVLEAETDPPALHRRHLGRLAVDEPSPASLRVQRMRSPARSSIISLL